MLDNKLPESKLEKVCANLFSYFEKNNFCGHDPFDGLNSRLFQVLPWLKQNRLAKLAWLQFHKRSPINFRQLVVVPKTKNPKAIALIIMGLIYAYRKTKEQAQLHLAKELSQWLLGDKFLFNLTNGRGWGYPFPWQSRAFFVEKNVPNIIVTSYVVNALALLAEETQETCYQEAIIQAGRFVITQLYNKEKGYFFYVPAEDVLVHNANLWGAVTVARAALLDNNDEWLQVAKKACLLSASAQQEDGSWVYGAMPHHQFIDGFHTGYNLETLDIYRQLTGDESFNTHIEKGYQYYIKHFFTHDYAAKYYHNAVYPLDTHSVSQAILTICRLGSEQDKKLLQNIIEYALTHLYDKNKGLFYYQKSKWITNKITYLRWTQAWMYYSFFYLLSEKSGLLK